MSISSQLLADNASFNAFLNCYLREIDSGDWIYDDKYSLKLNESSSNAWKIDLTLQELQLRLRVNVKYRSIVGRHIFSDASIKAFSGVEWQVADKVYVITAMVKNIYQQRSKLSALCENRKQALKSKELELLVRILDSHQTIALFIEQRREDLSLSKLDFLSTEQSSLYGHWLHPTPKSRQGMSYWQKPVYSPELKGFFKLHYFSIDRNLVSQDSVLMESASDIFLSELKSSDHVSLKRNHLLVPQHPLQAQNLLLDPQVCNLIAEGLVCSLGVLGGEYTATSSVRTLYRNDSPWMYKFSIPVKITNSLRVNKKSELKEGVGIEKYLNEVGFLDFRPQIKLVGDPAYLSVNLPGAPNRYSGFEVVIRRNIAYKKPENKICSILTLVQDPVSILNDNLQLSLLKQIITRIANEEHRDQREVAERWFDMYFENAIESLILLYDREGIALEAHLQNSLLDLSSGYPKVYYYRDNQGYYVSKRYKKRLERAIDDIATTNIFYDDQKIFEAFAYYVFFNQLFAVIYRLGSDELVPETFLVQRVIEKLRKLQKTLSTAGAELVDYLLEQESIACKTNLLARVEDIDELNEGMEAAVYTDIDNPLFGVAYANDMLQKSAQAEVCYVG